MHAPLPEDVAAVRKLEAANRRYFMSSRSPAVSVLADNLQKQLRIAAKYPLDLAMQESVLGQIHDIDGDSDEMEAVTVELHRREGLLDRILAAFADFPQSARIQAACCALYVTLCRQGLINPTERSQLEAKHALMSKFMACLVSHSASEHAVSAALAALGNAMVGNLTPKRKFVDCDGVSIALRAAQKWPRDERIITTLCRLLVNLSAEGEYCSQVIISAGLTYFDMFYCDVELMSSCCAVVVFVIMHRSRLLWRSRPLLLQLIC